MELFGRHAGGDSSKRGLSSLIWEDCPVFQYSVGLGGTFIFDDFMNFPALEDWGASAGSQDIANGYHVKLDTGVTIKQSAAKAGGVLHFDGLDADNDTGALTVADNVGALCRITDTAGSNYKVWFETRVMFGEVDEEQSCFVGLIEAAGLADTMLASSGTGIDDKDIVGFQVVESDVDALEMVYSTAASTQQSCSAYASALEADTWYKLGIRYDGTGVYFYVNGAIVTPVAASLSGESLTDDGKGVKPASDQFPDGDWLAPCWVFQAQGTGDPDFFVDWWAMGVELE